MLALSVFIIGVIASYIGAFIPWVSSSLTISTFILLGIPPQIAKSTFQIGGIGQSFGGLKSLIKTQKVKKEYIFYFFILCLFWAYIGWTILVSLPTTLLIRLTGLFMLIALGINFYKKELWIVSHEISRIRKWFGYSIYFVLNIFASVFPMGIGVLYQSFYTIVFRMTILEGKIIGKISHIPFVLWLIIPIYTSWFYNVWYILLYIVGSYIGSYFGIHHAIHIGNKVLKKIIMTWLLIIGLYFLFFA